MLNRDWIYLISQLLMAIHFIDARTIRDSTNNISEELCIPMNISVVLTSWHPVCITLHWACGYRKNGEWSYVNLSALEQLNKDTNRIFPPNELTGFRIIYSAYNTRYRYIQEVPLVNRTNIDNLQPNTKYTLTISSLSTNDQIGVSSQDVDFVSPAIVVPITPNVNDRYYSFSSLRLDTEDTLMKPGEVLVVIVVLCFWIYIIFHFIKKWGKIRSIPCRSLERSTNRSSSQLRSDENKSPRRYKSAEDLQNLVLDVVANQRKLSRISIRESSEHLENCTLLSNLDANNQMHNNAGTYLTQQQQYSGSNTTRGSFSVSRGSNGTLKFTDLASVAMVASNSQLNQLSRKASPSHSKSSSSGKDLVGSGTTCTGTCNTGNSAGTSSSLGGNKQKSSQNRQSRNIDIQIVDDSSASNHSTQATIARCERDLELSAVNCAYCRRRISNCDECTHCNGLNMTNIANRNLVLMQSKSFIQNSQTCSSENSSFENPCTSSMTNLNVANLNNSPGNGQHGFRTSQQCLFQISEANDDIKHIDED